MSVSSGPMRDFVSRHREGLLLAALLVASLLLISQQVQDNTGTTYLKRGAILVMSPLQKGVSGAMNFASGIFRDYLYLFNARAENRRLKREVNELQSEVQSLREELYRTGKLEEFAKYIESTGLKGVASRIIGESPDPWRRSIIVNRGSGDGIREGMAVVTPSGLVGRVLEVTVSTAVIRLITDRSSQVPVLVNRSRARAVLEGENSATCRLKYLGRTEDVREGDIVITSGLAGVYPRGVEVGTISRIIKENYGLYQYARILPMAPVDHLEDVLIITGAGTAQGVK